MTEKYIKVEDLQKYCDNQTDHTISPNEFQRMNHYKFGWQTGTPTEDGEYVCTVIVDLADRQDKPIKLKANYLFSFKDGMAENDVLGEPHKIIQYFKVPPYKQD